jgi:PAS domain S-box-containing protein
MPHAPNPKSGDNQAQSINLLKQKQNDFFLRLIHLIPIGVAVHTDGVATFINAAGINIMRARTADDILGKPAIEFVHPDFREGALKRIQALLKASKKEPSAVAPYVQEKFLRLDGTSIDVEVAAFPLGRDDERNAILVIFRDISLQKKGQKLLQEREARFRLLAETLPAIVFLVDETGTLRYINAAVQAISGYTPDEIRTIDYHSLVHPDSFRRGIAASLPLALGQSARFELKTTNKSGEWRWVDVTITKTIVDDKIAWLGVAQDITWQKKTETLLKQQSQKLVTAYEEERARIARELHDEVGQMLIGMKFTLESAQRSATNVHTQEALLDARQLLADLTENVRELSLSFRPSQLDDLGLIPTLLWHFERYTHHTKIRVDFNHAGFEEKHFSRTIETTLYRLVQEALTNVARHAGVDALSVIIRAQKEAIYLTIRDNGVGFDSTKLPSGHTSSGLLGMHERVGLLGGKLRIASQPGMGTTITATIPLTYPTP